MQQFTDDLWKALHGYYPGFVKVLPRLALAIVLFLLFLLVARQVRSWLFPRLLRNSGDILLTGFRFSAWRCGGIRSKKLHFCTKVQLKKNELKFSTKPDIFPNRC
jgi:hypothetical protein